MDKDLQEQIDNITSEFSESEGKAFDAYIKFKEREAKRKVLLRIKGDLENEDADYVLRNIAHTFEKHNA